MSSEVILSVKNLSKRYEIYDKPMSRLLQMLCAGRRNYFHEFWALDGISFEIRRGDSVGVIGRNGAGKSTLLQIITGTLRATRGSVWMKPGLRIAALLQLGSGFNPEFTGRENVYLNASILGLTRKETERRYKEIIEFADIGDFIDQPVKKYSSGMKMRLAFAVQIMVEPDILIVDEALAVGDVFFQQKCIHYMRKLKEAGCVLFFVSHAVGTVRSLCNKALLLRKGRMVAFGDSEEICNMYWDEKAAAGIPKTSVAEVKAGGQDQHPMVSGDYHEDPELEGRISERAGSGALRFMGFVLRGEGGQAVTCAMQGEKLRLIASVKACADVPAGAAYAISFNTKNDPGLAVVCSLSAGVALPAIKAGTKFTIETEFVSPFKKRRIVLNFSLKPDQHGGAYYDHVYTGVIYDSILRPEDEENNAGGTFCLPLSGMTVRF